MAITLTKGDKANIFCTAWDQHKGDDVTISSAVFEVFDAGHNSVQDEGAASIQDNGTATPDVYGLIDTTQDSFTSGGYYVLYTVTIGSDVQQHKTPFLLTGIPIPEAILSEFTTLDARYVNAAGDSMAGILTLPNTGLHLLDTDDSHDLIIKPGSDLTADKTLTITPGDSDRAITLSGNPTLADWFDQAVKAASSPTFAALTVPGTITSKVGRGATLVVAASDSSAISQAQADYVCDGTADDVQIQAAIDALSDAGGMIQLTEGNFHISTKISWDKPIILEGMGCNWYSEGSNYGTTLVLDDVYGTFLEVTTEVGHSNYFGAIREIGFDGSQQTGDISTGGAPAILIEGHGDLLIDHCIFYGFKYAVMLQLGAHGCWINNCDIEDCIPEIVGSPFAIWLHSRRNWINNCHFRGNKRDIYVDLRTQWITHCHFSDTMRNAIDVAANGDDIIIADCIFQPQNEDYGWNGDGTSYSCIQLNGGVARVSIHDNIFREGTAGGACVKNTSTGEDYINVHDNIFSVTTAPISLPSNANGRVARNLGYVTETSGTATVANGQTSVDVTHSLAITPSINDINVTPTNTMGNAQKYYISDIGASTFRINVDQDPGATTATFSWSIGSY